MALQAGTGGGEYLQPDEWVALGKEGALVAAVVTGHGTVHMEKGPSAGKDIDRVAFDLYILDGSRRGESLLGQDAIGRGIVAPLKRVQVGDEVAYRVGVGNAYGREYPQLNAPGDLGDEAVALFERLKAGESEAAPAKAPAQRGGAAKKAEPAKEPATVGGGASDGLDDEPDF